MRIRFFGLAIVCTSLLLNHSMARAEPQVVLTSKDGTTEVRGELQEFDGENYTMRTSLGVIGVPAAQVTCSGEGCPVVLHYGRRFEIEGSNTIGEGMLPRLIEGYADSLGAELVQQVGGGENMRVYRLTDSDGKEVAAISVGASGSAAARLALTDGSDTLGMSSGQLGSAADGAQEHVFAQDGLAVLVHPDNPLRMLTLEQIAALFAGRISNWSQIGGRTCRLPSMSAMTAPAPWRCSTTG